MQLDPEAPHVVGNRIDIQQVLINLMRNSADRIFEPFVTTKRGGMGMGLSICRSIIESHGGRLEFEPNPEGGALFRFTLPAVLPERDLDAS